MRILGITLPDEKRLGIALTSVYGIGCPLAKKIIEKAGLDPEMKTKDVKAADEKKLREQVENLKLEGDLKREVSSNIKRLKDISSYRGTRHSKRLPTRGQRTRTNGRTLRGARKTMGSGRTTVEKK